MKKEIINNNSDAIKIGKNQVKTISIILATVIITLLIVGFAFVYYPKIVKASKVDSFKKVAFDSIVCQYSCPLEEQEFKNKTQMLPNTECVTQCASAFQHDKLKYNDLTDKDLNNDNLIKDIPKLIDNCRTNSLINGTFQLENEKYFPCVSQNLETLKEQYSYLK